MENIVEKLMDICKGMGKTSMGYIHEKIYEPFFSQLTKGEIEELLGKWTEKIKEEKKGKRRNCEFAMEGLLLILFTERPEVHPVAGIPVELQKHIFIEDAIRKNPLIPEEVIGKHLESKYGKYALFADVITFGRAGTAIVYYTISSLLLSNLLYTSPQKIIPLIGRFNEREDKMELKEENLKKSLLFLMRLIASYNVSQKLPRPVTKLEKELFKFFNKTVKTKKLKEVLDVSVWNFMTGSNYDDLFRKLERSYLETVENYKELLDFFLTFGLSSISLDSLVKEVDAVLIGEALMGLHALALAATLRAGKEEATFILKKKILDFLYGWLVGYPFISVLEEEKRKVLEDIIGYTENREEGEESKRKEIALACHYNLKDYDKVLTTYYEDLKGEDIYSFTRIRIILAELYTGKISREEAIKKLEELSEKEETEEIILYLEGRIESYIEEQIKKIRNMPVKIRTQRKLDEDEKKELKQLAARNMERTVIESLIIFLLTFFPDDKKLLEKLYKR